jgi:uncharacterized SAM-binding protein YcdF (DUF218 family)
LLLLAVGLATGLYLGRSAWLPRVGSWLDVGRPPEHADAIVLLTGEAETRAFAAAALWKAGWAPRILVTAVAVDPHSRHAPVPPEHKINLRVLRACGVPSEAVVLLDGRASSTYDEAVAVADYLGRTGTSRLLVVTNAYHTRRARWIFQRVLSGRARQITMVSVPGDSLPLTTWWQNETGFAVITGEYLKLWFYILRYSYIVYEAAALVLLWFAWRAYRRKRLTGKDLGLMV